MWEPNPEEIKHLQLLANMCVNSAIGEGVADKDTFFFNVHGILQALGDRRVAELLDACNGSRDCLQELDVSDPKSVEAIEFILSAIRKATKSDTEFYCPE